jgi:hypothetical protein
MVLIACQNDGLLCCSIVGDGCAVLIESEAGKLSIIPASSGRGSQGRAFQLSQDRQHICPPVPNLFASPYQFSQFVPTAADKVNGPNK